MSRQAPANFVKKLRQGLDSRRRQKLRCRSLDTDGKGWLIDRKDPNRIFILGYELDLTSSQETDYDLSEIQRQYVLLKQELSIKYPDFTLGRVKAELPVYLAAPIFADRGLLSNLSPYRLTLLSLKGCRLDRAALCALRTEVELDGDSVALNLARDTYYDGCGFFVYDHPDSGVYDGLWCRPSPDTLAATTGEPTL